MYTKPKDCNLDALWEEYYKDKTIDARNKIITAYSYIVSCIAAKMRSICVNGTELDDIVNQGFLALIESIERYDGERGVKFESFASIRIRGAMIDYVRKQDLIPRRVRKVGKDIDNATARLWIELNREPTEDEISEKLGMTIKELRKSSTEVFNSNMLYFDSLLASKETGAEIAIQDDMSELQPEAYVMKSELKTVLAKAIDELNPKEKTVISLYYHERLKLKEIAYVLNVSESRVCQIHSVAVGKMNKYLTKNY